MGAADVRVARAFRFVGVTAVCVLGFLLAGPAGPALAAAESIVSYQTRIEVRGDGTLAVRETITYDFGAAQRHGIFRRIPARFRYDDAYDRVYPIGEVTVTMDGAGVPVTRSSEGRDEVLKIGDPDRTVTGRHTYVIGYTVRGALNGFADHVELYWNVIAGEWSVPIGTAGATVVGPGPIQRLECFAGPTGSRQPCTESTVDGARATLGQSQLGNGAGMTAVVAFPAGSVSDIRPVLVRRRGLASAFAVTPATAGGALGLALVGVAGALAVAWRAGRDRYYLGQLPGLAPGPGEPAVQRRKPLFGAPPVSVEFVPPGKIRPGQVGTLIDERASVVDVTTTIVDFAVRRHLLIKELRRPGRPGPSDWELIKLTDGDQAFLPYERTLFRALFTGRDRVRLSQLKNTFAADLNKVRRQLYADMVGQGWYRQSPARTRAAAYTAAVSILLGAAAITAVLALTTGAALVGLGLVAAALVLLAVAGTFPARTGRGSAALARVQGFRLYIATAEAEQIRFQEREQIFSSYLPYAIVFGLAGRWAGIFADLGTAGPDGRGGLYWYSGPAGWNAAAFGVSIGSFATATDGALTATPPSASGSSGFSGGGFSGGGAGGGGGGSW